MYNNLHDNESVEQGFLYICRLFNNIGFSFSFFLFFLSVVMLYSWCNITGRILSDRKLLLAFVIFISYMGIYYNGVVIRAYIAIMISYIGIYYFVLKRKKYLLYVSCCIIACFFHISAMAFIIIPFLLDRSFKDIWLYSLLFFSFALMLLNASTGFITNTLLAIVNKLSVLGVSRFSEYISRAEGASLSINSLKYLFSALFYIYMRNKVSVDIKSKRVLDLFLNIYVVGVSLFFILSFIPSASRLAQLFLFFEFVPIVVLASIATKKQKLAINLFISILILANYVSLFRFIPQLYNY